MKKSFLLGLLLLPVLVFSQTYYGDTIWVRDYSSNSANSCAFSPADTNLAVAYDCLGPMVRVLNVTDGSIIWESATPDLCLFNIQFSSSGQYIAIAEELGHLMVIDITIPDTLYNIDTQTGGLNAVDFSVTGDTVYAGGNDGSIRVYQTSTGSLLHNFTAHSGYVLTLDVSETGHYLATGSKDNTVKVWDLQNSYQLVYTFTNHLDDVKTVKFTPDENRLLSGSVDNTINAYVLADGSLDTVLTFHSADVNTIDISDDGSFAVSGSNDQSARMFNLNNYDSVSIFTNLLQTWVYGVAISHQMDKLATTNHVGAVIMYDISTLIGTEEIVLDPLIIYPNPAADFIQISNLAQAVNFEIISINGQVVQNGITANTIDIRSLPKGIYILHIGDRFSKIIKQ